MWKTGATPVFHIERHLVAAADIFKNLLKTTKCKK